MSNPVPINPKIPYCLPAKSPKACAMNLVQYKKLKTGGNDPKVSQKMRYSNYVHNYSKSRSVQPDVCASVALHPTDFNTNTATIAHKCTNSIFSANWRSKTGAQTCFCATSNPT